MSGSAEGKVAAEELLKQLKVSDLLLGTLASLVQLAYAKLAEGATMEQIYAEQVGAGERVG